MNESGIQPLNCTVLIAPEKREERTAGGLILPEQAREREQFAVTRGKIVAMCPSAFYEMEAGRPAVGDEVLFARHSGAYVDGLDGEQYRMVKDVDVTGKLEVTHA